ncbi:MAG: Rho termination factor N-terminal domain-containing protein [Thermodesulfobacteriota bacterium]
MAKKERKEKKEKPLEKMTTKELKEIALGIQGITGVHGMNKSELISAIKEARGIVEEKKSSSRDVRELKQKISALRNQKNQAKEAGDKKKAGILRKKMSRLKKKTRRAA